MDDIDSAFALFMNEVSSPKNTKKAKTADLGSSDSQVERLTTRQFFSAYDVLLLPPASDLKAIKGQYRKLSALVHPDKCRHPKANDAFLIVKKAYDDLQSSDYTDKYTHVIEVARELVLERRKQENKIRQKSGEELLPTEGPEFEDAVREECESLIQREAEERERAARIRASNEAVLAESRKRANREAKEATKKRKLWDSKLDSRVAGWRQFQQSSSSKEGSFLNK